MKNYIVHALRTLLVIATLSACEFPQPGLDTRTKTSPHDINATTMPGRAVIELKPHSATPLLVKKAEGFESVEVFPLISSEDQLEGSPNFVYGGSADGMGLLKSGSGYTLLVNHEDNFSVSRIRLDKSFRPVSGEYILNSNGGIWRLCSSTLATPEEHGFGPLYLTCGESGPESQTHGISPYADPNTADFSQAIPAFGRWSAENAVPLPKTAYPQRTVVLIGDDDSGAAGGQLAMYLTNAGNAGDLVGEKNNRATASVYVLRRTNLNTREMDLQEGQQVDVEFALISNAKDIKQMTGSQINAKSIEVQSLAFGRVEDIDYRKGPVNGGREIYFNVTGQDGNSARSKYGRVYKLMLDATNPLKGVLTLVLDGDSESGKARDFQNPDNILVTEKYAYIQEDPNTYGNEQHDAYVYQYNLETGDLTKVFELNHHRDNAELREKFRSTDTRGNWEYGALIDISDVIGVDNTFLMNIQPHTWRLEAFRNPDGGSIRINENQGSQTVVIKGLPR